MDRYIFSADLEGLRLRATRERDRYVTDLGELHAASSFLRVDLDGDEDLRMMVAACDAVIEEIDARRKDLPAFDADLVSIHRNLWDAVVGLSDVATHRKRRDAQTERTMKEWEERIAKGAAERASKRAALAERAKLPPEIVLRGPRTQADVAEAAQRIVNTPGLTPHASADCDAAFPNRGDHEHAWHRDRDRDRVTCTICRTYVTGQAINAMRNAVPTLSPEAMRNCDADLLSAFAWQEGQAKRGIQFDREDADRILREEFARSLEREP